MEQVVFEFVRGAVIGGCVMLGALLALRPIVIRWAATLLGQHQGVELREHTEAR